MLALQVTRKILRKYVDGKVGYIPKKLRALERWKRCKAVMVYIKVVLKPPSELHTTPKLSRKPKKSKKRNMYIKKQKRIVISNQKTIVPR
jgi:hypothetical protein